MQFHRLLTKGFGKLSGEYRFASEGMTLIVEDNERGKSTLSNALFFALYGEPDKNRHDHPLYRQFRLYRPWNSPAYQTTLEVSVNNRSIVVERDFGERPLVRVTDTETGKDITAEFMQSGRDEIGYRITGLSYPDAIRTIFVPQAMAPLGDSNRMTLTQTIQRFADTAAGESTAAKAVTAINDALAKYPFARLPGTVKVTDEIMRIDHEIASLTQSIDRMEQERGDRVGLLSKIDSLDRHTVTLQAYSHEIIRRSEAKELKELSAKLESDDSIREEWQRTKQLWDELEPFESTPLDLEGPIYEAHTAVTQQQQIAETYSKQIDSMLERINALGQLDASVDSDALSDLSILDDLRLMQTQFRDTESEIDTFSVQVDAEKKRLRDLGLDPVEFEREEQRWALITVPEETAVITSVDQLRTLTQSITTTENDRQTIENDLERLKERVNARSNQVKTQATLGGVLLGLGVFVKALVAGVVGWLGGFLLIGGGAGILIATYLNQRKTARETGQEIERKSIRLHELTSQHKKLHDEYEQLTSLLQAIAQKVGLANARDLYAAQQRRRMFAPSMFSLRNLNDNLLRWQTKRSELAGKIAAFAHKIGMPLQAKDITVPQIHDLRQRLETWFRGRKEREEAKNKRALLEEQLTNSKRDLIAAENNFVTLLFRGGISDPVSIQQRFDSYRNACKLRRRRQEIQQSLLPSLNAKRLPESERERYQQRSTELQERLYRQNAVDLPSEYASLEPVIGVQKAAEEQELIRKQQETLATQVFEYMQRVSRIGTTRRQLKQMLRIREQTLAFEAAAKLACDELKSMAQAIHSDWAKALNRIATERAKSFTGSVKGIRFGNDLSIQVELNDGRMLDEQAMHSLSIGARDQLYLAVRVAIADFLSVEHLPLVLDEPFAQADDTRFESGMELLLEEAKARQVILLTCHALRHRDWIKRHDKEVMLAGLAA
ncbi:MAG: AAA family ATPase [bacterium]|nr:AAA family ATPase [bacterium]